MRWRTAVDQALRLSRARLFTCFSVLLALSGCQAGKSGNAKSCGELAKQLCKGSAEATASCKGTLDLLTSEACAVALSKVDVSLAKLAAKRKKCDDMTAKLCAELGPETQTCAMVKEA